MAILITNKANFKLKLISKNKKHIMIKGSLHQKNNNHKCTCTKKDLKYSIHEQNLTKLKGISQVLIIVRDFSIPSLVTDKNNIRNQNNTEDLSNVINQSDLIAI